MGVYVACTAHDARHSHGVLANALNALNGCACACTAHGARHSHGVLANALNALNGCECTAAHSCPLTAWVLQGIQPGTGCTSGAKAFKAFKAFNREPVAPLGAKACTYL